MVIKLMSRGVHIINTNMLQTTVRYELNLPSAVISFVIRSAFVISEIKSEDNK